MLRWLARKRDKREENTVVEARNNRLPTQNRSVSDVREVFRIVSRDEVDLIMKALCTSWSWLRLIAEPSGLRELSFQVVGRLIDANEEMKGIKQYLDSVRERTRMPHMLPGRGCLSSVRDSVEEAYVGREVHSIALLPDPNKVVVSTRSKAVSLVDVRSR